MLNLSVNNDDGNSGWALAEQRAESLRQRAEEHWDRGWAALTVS